MKKITALVLATLTVLTAGAAATTPVAAATAAIPKGFLLYEKDAAKKDNDPETNWKVTNSPKARLAVNPCDRSTLAATGRVAARTVTFVGVPDFMKVEQVILYDSRAAAVGAVAKVRAALVACRSKTDSGSTYRYTSWSLAGLGDEALRISGQVYYGGKAGVGGEPQRAGQEGQRGPGLPLGRGVRQAREARLGHPAGRREEDDRQDLPRRHLRVGRRPFGADHSGARRLGAR